MSCLRLLAGRSPGSLSVSHSFFLFSFFFISSRFGKRGREKGTLEGEGEKSGVLCEEKVGVIGGMGTGREREKEGMRTEIRTVWVVHEAPFNIELDLILIPMAR